MTEATAMYSYVNMILLSIMGGVFVVFLAIGSWWASSMNRKLSDATDLGNKISEWSKSHDKQDDERHDENRERLDRNHTAVHALRDQVSDLAVRFGLGKRAATPER